MSQILYDQKVEGVMSYGGPTIKSQYKKKGNTVRSGSCCKCNVVGHRTLFTFVSDWGNIIYSLDKKGRWNDMNEVSTYYINSDILTRSYRMIKFIGSEKTTDRTDSGRQARKKIRQEKAKQNLNKRKTRKIPTNDNTTTTETITQPENNGYDSDEDEQQTKEQEEYIMLYGKHLDPAWKGKFICKQCHCFEWSGWKEETKTKIDIDFVLFQR
eukprot:TRINITY_DN353_c0_g1_i1.p1 TRINITY_DN353_c0_g1~~TRINITY_DN353_c0_g1_i1.p1  ORF type:complete len:212 (-),score=25.63 TRINITY_DN353_c0_g1_i1:92-727(-)